MKPNEACRDVAVPTIKLLLHHVPQRLHALGTMVASALLDDRLRAAIMSVLPFLRRMLTSVVQAPRSSQVFAGRGSNFAQGARAHDPILLPPSLPRNALPSP